MADQGLLAMVSSYGAVVKPELVMDRSALTIPFQQGGMLRLMQYPFWVGVRGQYANQANPVTAGFAGVDMFWPNPVELNPPASVNAEPLFSSTPDAWLQTRDFAVSPEMEYLFTREEPDTRGTKILAAALSGKFPSWFAGMPKPVREGFSGELPDMPAETRESRMVVVGDVDLGSTLIQVTQGERNLDFLLQAADWLGNDDDIIGIRNRLPQAGRLDRITDPVKRIQAMLFARFLNVVIIPLALIAAGVLRAWRRRRAAKAPLPAGKEFSDEL
jgi:ABC-2 type transport system permease protein